MDYDEKNAAFEEYTTRSLHSQTGWARRQGPNRHLSSDQRLELTHLRAAVRIFLLENPPTRPKSNKDLPF